MIRFFKAVLAGLAALAILSSVPVFATTITVSNTSDSGAGSLRQAIADALPGDTINFSVTGTINLTSGELNIDKDLTISGPSAATLSISGNALSRVFNIGSVSVAISGLTIQNGNAADYGGGIYNIGVLTLTNSTVSGNVATAVGGGIMNFIALTLTNSTVSGNSVGSSGGGIYNIGVLTLTNSTVSGNVAPEYGGGIHNPGTLTLANSTVSGNSAALDGGGIYSFGLLTLKNTIIANSASGGNCANGGAPTSQGHNLSDDASCVSFFNAVGDLNSTPAALDPNGLQDNGGPTKTIALLLTSPAVNAIPVSDCDDAAAIPVATDQRGVARPQGSGCDIGAFELLPYATQVQQPINPDGSSVFSVRRGVVPVKFSLTYFGGVTCQLPPATISLVRTAGAVPGSIDESAYLLASDSGSNFRIDATNCQYVYNVATRSLGTGTYVASISIGGNVVGSGTFGLK